MGRYGFLPPVENRRCPVLLFLAALFTACSPVPPPVPAPRPDPALESWYGQAANELAALHRDAKLLLQNGKPDRAAAIITSGQPLINRLLSAPRPTLAAMEAVSDLDDLYGRMLLGNRHYGWARLLFQKNQVRWQHWRPQTEDTLRRKKLAETAIAECDRNLAK